MKGLEARAKGGGNAIEVDALSKRYGDFVAVDGVTFTVKFGEVFALLGSNGAGKTTTAEIVETIRAPTSGTVRVLGMDVTTQKHNIVPRIGVLPQSFNSFDLLTVRETLQYYSRLFGCSDANIDGLIERATLSDKRDMQFRTLSGGLKQRLGIAIALVNDPEVVFLDEPTTGLDPQARRAVWDVLLGLKRKGKAVFLTTHYMEEAELLADTVAIVSRGRLIAMGSPDALVKAHAHHLCLTLSSADPQVTDALRKMHFDPVAGTPDDNTLKIRVKNADDVRDILSAITRAGATLPAIEVRRSTLEDVYLAITDGVPNDGTPAHGATP